ncbi:MAG: 30S ribosome-binding factor RbfA [Bdellovibrionales bacterium]
MAESTASRRVLRYEKLIRQVASDYLLHRINDPEMGWAQVTRVQVKPDLRSARIFVHFQESEDAQSDVEALKAYAPDLQKRIYSQVRSKYCPKIQFVLDKGFEKVLRVERLIHELSQESANPQ